MIEASYNAKKECIDNVIGKRIIQARKEKGWTLSEFCDDLHLYGVETQLQGVSKWERGERVPNAYQLLAVCKALDIKDALAYFTGEGIEDLNEIGLHKLSDYRDDLVASGRYAPKSGIIEYMDMPVSTLGVSAGTGEFLDDGNYEMVSFPADSVPKNAKFGVRVAGDSMEPVYNDGQIVWVEECHTLSVGEVGIFIYDGCGYLKVYGEQTPEDTDAFTDSFGVMRMQPVLISYNCKYEPRVVQPDLPFEIVGKVVK